MKYFLVLTLFVLIAFSAVISKESTDFNKYQISEQLKDEKSIRDGTHMIFDSYAEILQQAEDGDKKAQFQVGLVHNFQYDLSNAFLWYSLAAQQGVVRAQYKLGGFYQGGYGVTRDIETAKKWYQKAAMQGDMSAQLSLAQLFRFPSCNLITFSCEGVVSEEVASKNYPQAVKWYKKAAEQGNASAQHSLGHMLKDGLGVKKNYSLALKWYKLAAAQGDEVGMSSLGTMYKDALGVPQNYRLAYQWYSLAKTATEYEYSEAELAEMLKWLEQKLTLNELVTAQNEALKCWESNYKDCDL